MSLPLSIIIPAYNEAERLGESLRTIIAYLKSSRTDAEIIVVDDGSSDATIHIAEEIFARTPEIRARAIRNEPNRGKGHAVRTGLEAAQGEIALFSDADLSTPIDELTKLVQPIEAGEIDVAFGSRELDKSLIQTHQSWQREQGGRVFNSVVRFLTGLPFHDTQCGFKAFRMSVFRPLLQPMTIDRFGFDIEFLFVAHLARLRLREIPVRWAHCEGSKVNVWRDSRRTFVEVRQIRRNAKKGVYDSAIKAVTANKTLIELSEAEAKI